MTIMMALDIQKAFDTVWIDGLLLKLAATEIPAPITRWIAHLLTNRTAITKQHTKLLPTFGMRTCLLHDSRHIPLFYTMFVAHILPTA